MMQEIDIIVIVEVKDPLKQGLKPSGQGIPKDLALVEVKDPLKQGLKPTFFSFSIQSLIS